MKHVEARTVVASPQPEVFEHVAAFPRYGEHSRYLDEVTPVETEGEGDAYDVRAGWWKLGHTVRTTVTEFAAPERINWRVEGDLEASGEWNLEAAAAPAGDTGPATGVELVIRYDPDSAVAIADLPAFVPVGPVVERAGRALENEVERMLGRIARGIDGEERSVEIAVGSPPRVDG